MSENYTILYDANEDFIHSAKIFCDFLENPTSVNSRDFLKATQLYLFKIYQLASNIEKKDTAPELISSDILSNEQLDKIVELIKKELLDYRYYWIVFNPINDKDTEPVCGDLLDDVIDIYRDIKRALLLYDSGLDDTQAVAIWQAKFNFENHWGDHCANAIYACHYFLRTGVERKIYLF